MGLLVWAGRRTGSVPQSLLLRSIARDSEHTPNVIRNYPQFGQLLARLGIIAGGVGGMQGLGGGMQGCKDSQEVALEDFEPARTESAGRFRIRSCGTFLYRHSSCN